MPEQEKNRQVYTVSEVTQDIKLILESTFAQVWIEGEISNFRPSGAGHFYFSLKDDKAILGAVIFNGNARGIKFKIEDGLKVICFGRIEVYPPHGKYQLIIEKIEPKGIGSLQLALEQLKDKLQKEGLFSAEHKRQVPYLPRAIGVVTSATGAAIKDIFKVMDRRFKDIHIIVISVKVQGEGAKEEIAQAIKDLNCFNQELPLTEKIEVMIVGRGGGSIEDLWAFNEEFVARAIYGSAIPVISAVGHERDVTIADLVADLRASTPSAAAEMVIPKKEDLREKLNSLAGGLRLAISRACESSQNQLDIMTKKLSLLNPVNLILQFKDKVDNLARQIYLHTGHNVRIKEAGFTRLAGKMASLNPLNILNRGYSVTFKLPQLEIIKDAAQLNKGDMLKIRLHKGEIISTVTEV